ncbi:uncharacterized protein LOC129741996 [Uranotaenia lowii]|uniref:uncharacterized protein LOC129741996 n=1 Tax=Uranotaenia lowii TaxID=190385 RepID=UPI00247A4BBF|nr:uncharacterized protein LOC129741996 [Uranotaenia lowii]
MHKSLTPPAAPAPAPQNYDETNCNIHRNQSNEVLFRVVPVTLHGTGTVVHTYALLDDGSELSLIDEDLAEQLQLEGARKAFCLKWTGDTRRYEENSRVVNLCISGAGGALHALNGVRTVHELNLPHQSLVVEELTVRYPYLKGLPIQSYHDAVPRILIGLDHAHLGNTLKLREGSVNQPIAAKSRLGWLVFGSCVERRPASVYANVHYLPQCECIDDAELHKAMKNYFSLDSMGVVQREAMLSTDDQRALHLLQTKTLRLPEKYEVCLLWKYENVRLPDSKVMALRRWECLEKRLSKDQSLARILKEKIEDYLEKNYIRKLTKSELESCFPRVWYLPIFPVVNPNKPSKVRIVWDAAAKAHNVSLNSVLLKGPDQLCSLLSVLLKFREFRVAFSGDIREMYHQVMINETDQQCQRFFWKDDPSAPEPSVFVMQVMTFGASCSPSCAQFIKNTHARKFSDRFPEAVDVIINKHYVDDALVSVENEEDAIRVAKEVHEIHRSGGFEIRNWISNSQRFLNALSGQMNSEKNLNICSELATEKILGMYWDTASDMFRFKLSSRHDPELLLGKRIPTKREVLRTLMMIFDPLGLIGHVLMYLKVILQEIWRAGTAWDEAIDNDPFRKWLQWLKVLPNLEDIRIPRCFRALTSASSATEVQLHTFVDASESGFAAAVFLRFEEGVHIECSLVGTKTRVSPLKFLTIPRSELQAGVLGARFASSVIKSLSIHISHRFYWTDSRNLLCWLKSDHRRYSQFVGTRVSEILELTDISEWNWVPTKDNVSDDGTKWRGVPDISENSRWFKGPPFIYQQKQKWPKIPSTLGATEEELRPRLMLHYATCQPIVEVENFSKWVKLYRLTAMFLRAVKKFIVFLKIKRESQRPCILLPLSQDELIAAQNLLYRQVQSYAYPEEYSLLQKPSNTSLPKRSSLFRVSPFLDEHQVMRIHNRAKNCQFTDLESKNPIVLPPTHHLTKLIAQHYHRNLLHRNHETAINRLRLRYYIPKLRAFFRRMRGDCQQCKNANAKPQPPAMADLPASRLAAFCRPFTYVGVDYFGPIPVSVGRRSEKRWGVLVTCLTTRAIYIELAHSLTTDSCIMALRVFMVRRGVPAAIYSDRGTNFIGASKELSIELDKMNQNKLIAAIVSPDTRWEFNPPASPHMGGSWERLIQSVKKNLQNMTLTRLPSDEVLRCALTEIEGTVNSRPLTFVALDDEDSPVLTPNHFILGSSDGLKPLALFDDSSKALKKSWHTSQLIANIFWRHWLNDYLPCLTRRSKWFNLARPISVGDVVVIADPNSPRNTWPKGRVIGTSHAKDGQVRWAVVQTAHGIYERPAVKIAVLDVGVQPIASQEECGRTTGGTVIGAVSNPSIRNVRS